MYKVAAGLGLGVEDVRDPCAWGSCEPGSGPVATEGAHTHQEVHTSFPYGFVAFQLKWGREAFSFVV